MDSPVAKTQAVHGWGGTGMRSPFPGCLRSTKTDVRQNEGTSVEKFRVMGRRQERFSWVGGGMIDEI